MCEPFFETAGLFCNSSFLDQNFTVSFNTVKEKFAEMYHLRQRMGQISMIKANET